MLREFEDQDPRNLKFRGSDNQGPNNWRRLWETNKKSRQRTTKAWLQLFSSSSPLPKTLSTPPSASNLPEAVAMSNNPMHQTPEDQFLHWLKEMERKHEEQARQMQELQARVEHLQRENDQLWSQVEKSLELGNYVREGNRVEHHIVRTKGKEPIISSDGDAPADDELSSRRPPSTSPSPGRNARGSTRAKSQRKHSHRLTLNDAVSGASRQVREQIDRRQNQPLQAP